MDFSVSEDHSKDFEHPRLSHYQGFLHQQKKHKIKIHSFVLDAPARTSCKRIKHINGYFGCDVCTTEGYYNDHRMTYPDLSSELRTDKQYRERQYEDYHKKESVLELLPVDMILSFPLDYLHCLLVGVVKWMLGYFKNTSKVLSSRDWILINERVKVFDATRH